MGENPFSKVKLPPGEVITELAKLVGDDGGLLILSLWLTGEESSPLLKT